MDITISVDIDADTTARLTETLGTAKPLSDLLPPYAQAAFVEYIEMMTGEHVTSSAVDLREYRLRRIPASLGTIPDDELVGNLFQLTASQSRSLIRDALAKYQYALEPYLNQALYDAIKTKAADYELAPNVVELLRLRAQRLDPKLEPITKVQGKALYEIPDGTRLKLIEDLMKRGAKG